MRCASDSSHCCPSWRPRRINATATVILIACLIRFRGPGGTTGRFANGHSRSKCDLCVSGRLLGATAAIASIGVAGKIADELVVRSSFGFAELAATCVGCCSCFVAGKRSLPSIMK